MNRRGARNGTFRGGATAAAMLFLGCAILAPSNGRALDLDSDPLEIYNRPVHSFNLVLDRTLLRNTASTYLRVVSEPNRNIVRDFLRNLREPMAVMNFLLQRDLENAGVTSLRFALNTFIGLAGLIDVAGEAGLEHRSTDFGLTLASLDIGQGPFITLPLLGPSTVRDAVGGVASVAVDPVNMLQFDLGTRLVQRYVELVEFRSRNYSLVNDLLYHSTDSYIAVRSSYLQRRTRQESSGESPVENLPDLFDFEEEEDF